MPMEYDDAALQRLQANAADLFKDMAKILEEAGGAGAEAIVRFTLAGVGEHDKPFAPYSEEYQALLDSVGGKPQGTVNLRGVFYHHGQGPGLADLGRIAKIRDEKKRAAAMAARMRHEAQLRKKGALRQSFKTVTVRQVVKAGGSGLAVIVNKTILVKTALTRPARGVVDPLSEMSLDLIKAEATDNSLRLVYTPRKEPYMLYHQQGRPGLPQRKWFTFDRAGVVAAMVKVISTRLAQRVAAFNKGQNPAWTSHQTPPPPTSSPISPASSPP